MLKKLFFFPSQNLVLVIPISLLLGFLLGSMASVEKLKFIMPLSMLLMVYPTMIGFKIIEFVNMKHKSILITASIINFLFVPLVAFVLGSVFLKTESEMFAGLALASLLPTSGMTISWTMLNKGNVPAALKITALSLVAGALLTPAYLNLMIGRYIDFDMMLVIGKLVMLVFVPMILGNLTYRWITKKYSPEHFQSKIKPVLPAVSSWGMLTIIFYMVAREAQNLMANPSSLITATGVLLAFYLINFTMSTLVGKFLYGRADGLTLVYSTVLRNLSIALGLAVSTFGPKAGLILTLAFVIQVQGAAWYARAAKRLGIFTKGEPRAV